MAVVPTVQPREGLTSQSLLLWVASARFRPLAPDSTIKHQSAVCSGAEQMHHPVRARVGRPDGRTTRASGRRHVYATHNQPCYPRVGAQTASVGGATPRGRETYPGSTPGPRTQAARPSRRQNNV